MPLIKSPSKKAFKENLETEMESKPKKQSLAIAFSTMRQSRKKKMARGGEVSAVDERRPSADERDERGLDMDGGPNIHAQELSARDEDRVSEDERESRGLSMYASGGRVAGSKEFPDTELDVRDRHDRGISDRIMEDGRDMKMLDGKPRRHSDELDAKSEREVDADSESDREMDMMRQKGQEDSYSKDGIVRYADGGDVVEQIMKRRRMAEGGQVDLQDSNGDEHLNEEDQLSYKAARSKTYFDDSQLSAQPEDSNEHGDELEDEDSHDMVGQIRRKMRK